jgi:hypothetical protein
MSKVDLDKTCEIVITSRHVAIGEEWRSREEIATSERKSRKMWDDFSNEKRAAVLILMRDAMERLIEDPHVWVPTSMEAKSGNRLDIFISLNIAEVDEEVLRRRVETERTIAETSTDLVVLQGELRGREE